MSGSEQLVSIPTPHGSFDAVLARPEGEGPFPAVAILHAIDGVTPHMQEVAGRLAAQGYVAVVPDLFWNQPAPPQFTSPASFMQYRQELDDPSILDSVRCTTTFLRGQEMVDGKQVAILGFCMGGYYAFLEAAHDPALGACVDFYGGPLRWPQTSDKHPMAPIDVADQVRVPVLGLFGADDPSIPVEAVQELKNILEHGGVPLEVHIYPGAGHGFFNDSGRSYQQEAAQDAWQRTVTFMHHHVKE